MLHPLRRYSFSLVPGTEFWTNRRLDFPEHRGRPLARATNTGGLPRHTAPRWDGGDELERTTCKVVLPWR